jgi:hypothetical protein
MQELPVRPSDLAVDLDVLDRLTDASSYADAVHRLLTVARTSTRMSIAWVSEFVGTEQVLRFVDSEPGTDAPLEGTCMPLGGTYCARVLDGSFPPLIPDARRTAAAALLDMAPDVNIGAYVGVPLLGPSGSAVGMLCAVDPMARSCLEPRDLAALELLAQVLRDLQRRAVTVQEHQQERRALRRAVTDVLSGTGRHPVLQAIVDLTTGRVYAAEGLTRFTAPRPDPADGAGEPRRRRRVPTGRRGGRDHRRARRGGRVRHHPRAGLRPRTAEPRPRVDRLRRRLTRGETARTPHP